MSETQQQREERVEKMLDRFVSETNMKELFSEDNMALLEFDFGQGVILPHADAVTVLSALSKAEAAAIDYGNAGFRLLEKNHPSVTIKMINPIQYRRAKIANHLGLDHSDVECYFDNKDKVPF